MTPEPPSAPASLQLQLVAGLLDQVREIIGDESTAHMLHFAAAEEGRTIAREDADDLEAALRKLAALVGSPLELVEERPDGIRIRAPGFDSQLMARPVQEVLLGLLEGVFTQARHRPYAATLDGHVGPPVIELRVTEPKEAV